MADINITVSIDAAISITIDTNAVPSLITQAEAEAGTSTGERVVTAERLSQAIAALESADATPGGSDTQLQFNDGGVFGAEASLTYTKATNKLCLGTSGNSLLEEHRGKIYQIMQDVGSKNGTYQINVGGYNDTIVTADGNLILQMTGHAAGMSGVIILKITGAGGYTISLDPTYFTTELSGSDDIDTVTGKKNFISYYYDGTFLYYTNTKEA
jgi:hypothetical protein